MRELEAVEAFLGDVCAGRGCGLLVTGEAGIGKTALLEAARERAEGFPRHHGSSALWSRVASGFLALDLGDAQEAIDELEAVERLVELASMENPLIVPWAPDLVEAYCRAGREEGVGAKCRWHASTPVALGFRASDRR